MITAVTIASTIALPTCIAVFTSPDASPCSSSATPLVAAMLTDGKASANPMPSRTMLGSTSAT